MELTASKKFMFAWSSIGAVALSIVALLPWRFQVNDDVIMMWLVSGAYTGTPEPYAVFIHPVLSWVFSKLYIGFPLFPWYESVWFLGIYFSFILLLRGLLATQLSQMVKSLMAFFLLLVSLHLTIFLQFTLVAGFLTFSALVFLMENRPVFTKIVAFVLLTLGIMIRWESAVLIVLGYFFFIFFSQKLTWSPRFLRKFGIVSLLFILIIGSKFIYEENSPYADFLRFNRLRASVIDHPVFYQEVVEKKIPEDSELFFFSRWYFEDSGVSEADLREKKIDLDAGFWSMDYTLDAFERLWGFQRFEVFKSFLIFGILVFFFFAARKSSSLVLFFGAWMLFFLTFNHFYLIQGRVIFLFFLCLIFPFFKAQDIYLDKRVIIGLVISFSLTFGFHFLNFWKEAKGRDIMDNEFLTLKNKLNPSTPMVIEGYYEHNWKFKFSALNPVPFIATGWISRSVFQKKALERMNLSSLADIQEYALITPTTNTEIVFPDYMNHAFGDFVQTDSIRSANFILLLFQKKDS